MYLPVRIEVLADGQIILAVMLGTVLTEDDVTFLPVLLAPLLRRSSGRFIGAETEGAGARRFMSVLLTFGRRGSTVQDAVDVGMDVAELADASEAGHLSAHSIFSLVTAGRAELLVGLAESSWLEAKSQGYDLETDHGRIELAQDIARFANSDEPGILIIGLRTRKIRGSDVIIKTSPSLDPFDAGRYHRNIDSRLFPPVQGLMVQNAPVHIRHGSTGNVLAIYVPAQPEEAKPFLVHGAIVRDKIEGAFISIVQRRGEHSVAVTAAAIHATLAAGRALLRRGEVPPGGRHAAKPSIDGGQMTEHEPDIHLLRRLAFRGGKQ
jgi:hypothetical protein